MSRSKGAPFSSVSVVGARPQFVKIAPVSRALAASGRIVDRIVHTGQHYDDEMSRVFFSELEIPPPAENLGVGSGPQGRQTGRMLEALENYLLQTRPDVVVVYGDTNSTLAGALAASKLHLPVVHVEAGLRSFNRRMPEELNRIAADHLSAVLCAPTPTAMINLEREGLAGRAQLTGDVMYDAVLHYATLARQRSPILDVLGRRPGSYGVVTLHRAENTTREELEKLLGALNRAASRFGPFIFPMHPRTRASIEKELPSWAPDESLDIIKPVSYLDMLALLQGARWVLTDSGGLQKEAYFLGCPCITLRAETEWLETLAGSHNVLAGNDGRALFDRLESLAAEPARRVEEICAVPGPFGSGDAAKRIVESIIDCVSRHHD